MAEQNQRQQKGLGSSTQGVWGSFRQKKIHYLLINLFF